MIKEAPLQSLPSVICYLNIHFIIKESPAITATEDPPAGANPMVRVRHLLSLSSLCTIDKCLWTPGNGTMENFDKI